MLATTMFPAVPILASRLNISFVNYFPAGAIEPFFTTLYRGSNRRAFLPNPLSYMPQVDLHVTSQHMVRCSSVFTLICYIYIFSTTQALRGDDNASWVTIWGCVCSADILGAAAQCVHLPQIPLH